jgi:hypothetical protein
MPYAAMFSMWHYTLSSFYMTAVESIQVCGGKLHVIVGGGKFLRSAGGGIANLREDSSMHISRLVKEEACLRALVATLE